MDLVREVFYNFVWDGVWPRCLTCRGFVACDCVVAFREVVVKSVLWCGCGCCGVCVGVWVEWVLPWRGGIFSGVVRECSFSKWFCSISMIWVGDVVMVFVVGSLRASSFG